MTKLTKRLTHMFFPLMPPIMYLVFATGVFCCSVILIYQGGTYDNNNNFAPSYRAYVLGGLGILYSIILYAVYSKRRERSQPTGQP